MLNVLYLDSISTPEEVQDNVYFFKNSFGTSSVNFYSKFSELLVSVTKAGASELDLEYPTVVIISDGIYTEGSSLDSLPFQEMKFFLERVYNHLNVLVYSLQSLHITRINTEIQSYHSNMKNRIIRMKTWIGLNNRDTRKCPCLHNMTNCLTNILEGDSKTYSSLIRYVRYTNSQINYRDLLKLRHPEEYYLHCIGNWGFIAHELSCDELTFCAFSIFKQVFEVLETDNELILDDNDLLAFLISVRNSYRGGNAFHNFRHAVDVLQSTFYILIKTGALPKFRQFTEDLEQHPSDLHSSGYKCPSTTDYDPNTAIILPIQSLALLVASIGHDVGHPGLTNLFLVKHNSPIAKIYSNQSVLENYHSTTFQDILSIFWPSILHNEYSQDADALNTKKLQVNSIIATDMDNHLQYVNKIAELKQILDDSEKRKLIKTDTKLTNLVLSLIIKCSDISNVARPLSISTKWGVVLSREFQEMAKLQHHLDGKSDSKSQDQKRVLPDTIEEALQEIPNLPNSQIYFIDTFAQDLFVEISLVLPSLAFTVNTLINNRKYWDARISDNGREKQHKG